jgi:hypothetical protein
MAIKDKAILPNCLVAPEFFKGAGYDPFSDCLSGYYYRFRTLLNTPFSQILAICFSSDWVYPSPNPMLNY